MKKRACAVWIASLGRVGPRAAWRAGLVRRPGDAVRLCSDGPASGERS